MDEPTSSCSLSDEYGWHRIAPGNLNCDANHGYRGHTRRNDASIYQDKSSLPTSFDLGEAQQRTDLRIYWNARGGRGGLVAFVNNVFGEQYVSGLDTISRLELGTPYACVTRPRMWGTVARSRFLDRHPRFPDDLQERLHSRCFCSESHRTKGIAAEAAPTK